MIDSVKIGHLTYAVHEATNSTATPDVLKPDAPDEYLCGEIVYSKAVIYIQDEMTADVKVSTLMHEILHGILRQTGHYEAGSNEGLVNALAFGLVALLRDNPALYAYLTNAQQE